MNVLLRNTMFILISIIVLNINIYSQESQTKPISQINVAILVYDGIYLLDFTGPMEVFADASSVSGNNYFNVYTVAQNKKDLTAHTGLQFSAKFDITSSPQADILIIPGGRLDLLKDNPILKDWIINSAKNAKTVLSVCTGAFLLADSGLLENLEVTTWHGVTKYLKKKVPSIKLVENVRYTDNGKIITTAGVSAGIDGSLYVVSKYLGDKVANATAIYMDYDYWRAENK